MTKHRCAVVVVVVAALVALVACGSGAGRTETRTGSDPHEANADWKLVDGRFTPVPRPTLDTAGSILPLDDGSFLLYGGSNDPAPDDGKRPGLRPQIFEPTTGVWRVLPDDRLGALYPPVVAATRTGFVVFGTRCDKRAAESSEVTCQPGGIVGAAYDTKDHTWKATSVPDGLPKETDASAATRVWARTESTEVLVSLAGKLFTYESGSGQWTAVDPDPNARPNARCGTTDGFVSVTFTGDNQASASVLQPDGSWATESADLTGSAKSTAVICSESSVLLVGAEAGKPTPYVYRFVPHDRSWERLDDAPADLGVPEGGAIAMGSIVSNADGTTYVFRDADRSWEKAAINLGMVTQPTVGPDGTFVGYTLAADDNADLHPTLSAGKVVG